MLFQAVLVDRNIGESRVPRPTAAFRGSRRDQPLHLSITTAGFDRHSICWEQHGYAEQVLSGVIVDSAFFALIYAAGMNDDWTDPEVGRKANPGFGVTVSEDQFAEDRREARESPAKENSFRRYRLNQWVESETRWLSLEKWDACSEIVDDLPGKPCWAGLDLSSTTDLSAFVLVFPIEDRYAVLPFFWVRQAPPQYTQDASPNRQASFEGLQGEAIPAPAQCGAYSSGWPANPRRERETRHPIARIQRFHTFSL
jgi:phage terminase large subunit-like protein